MFLFILESIGTPELLLIAVVALIVLGPRRLPQMAKTVAKTIAEFKNATNEFKSTWEKEAAFDNDIKPIAQSSSPKASLIETGNLNAVPENQNTFQADVQNPQIRELTPEDVAQNFQNQNVSIKEKKSSEEVIKSPDKRDWL